jgi:polyhydroxybutyrate depolymerase
MVDTHDYASAADEQQSLLVFPETTSVSGIAVLLDHLSNTMAIDEERVFAQGASAGGLLAARIACEMSDRIAAVGTGAGFDLPDPVLCERPSRPVPVTSFIDPVDPYFEFGDVEEAHARWAEWNDCDPVPTTETVGTDVEVIRWIDCDDEATVEVYIVAGLGHRWAAAECLPGQESFCAEIPDFDAGTVQWEFFVAHPLR